MTADLDPLADLRETIEGALRQYLELPKPGKPSSRLDEAMRYAVLGGGKRIRPLLTLATARSLGGDTDAALAPACAVEFIHAYSLVHDDLPAMDDDDLRRGRATVHKAFDEATAILAGDALQALAFEVVANAPLSPTIRATMIARLARAAGAGGMVGGQSIDMTMTGRALDIEQIEQLHDAKTGALLAVAVELGGLAANASDAQLAQLAKYGHCIGRAFQVVDDLLDVTESTAAQGKRAGVDAQRGKNTFPGLLGVDATREYARDLCRRATAGLEAAGIADGPLYHLARQIVERTH